MRYPIFFLAIIALVLFPEMSIAQQYRLVERVSYNRERDLQQGQFTNNYYISDSSLYSYATTSNRGSNYNADTINYDTLYSYKSVNASLVTGYRVGRLYTANDLLQTHSTEIYDATTKTWSKYSADTLIYNNGLVTKMMVYQGGGGAVQNYAKNAEYDYTYDANGRLQTEQQSWYGSATMPPQPQMMIFYSYDANGLHIKDSVLDNAFGVWKPSRLIVYDYDQNQRLQTTSYYLIDSLNNNHLYFKNYYSYTTQGLLAADSAAYIGPLGNWSLHKYTYNAKGLLIADTFSAKSFPVEYPLTTYDYTSFDYISGQTMYYYDSANSRYDHFLKSTYRYEAYWPVGVSEVVTNSADITLYPNPASGELNIAWHNAAAGKLQARIVDVRGQVQAQWSEEVHGDYKKTISTGKLPVGQYYLQLQSGNRMYTKIFMVMH